VNSLGGLIIFRMLGAYVDSSAVTLIPVLWVHYRRWTSLSLSALWSFIPAPPAPPVGSSLSLRSLLCRRLISSNWCCSWCVRQPERHDSGLELPVPGAKCGFVLVAFLDSEEVIGIPEVLSSISEISGTGYRFFTAALLRAR